ncbi:sensor histidine kinase [Paenibacillus lemnae]|uniref:histidine kinase n=1 Tax=Paenibacillus lemnae TaxID=1330551 RepID=A0A848M5E6_PAELE|nr:histidine kinase [Paenibacillus lemnae]NMO95450.1 histidine kinase [Paenibacillus lemnae]
MNRMVSKYKQMECSPLRLSRNWNLSVTWKFILAFLFILTLSMTTMGIILYYQASKSAIGQGQVLMNQNVLQMKNNILQKANMVQDLAEIIAFDPKMQNFFESPFLNGPHQLEEYRDTIAPILDNLKRQNAYIHSIRVYMANSTIPERHDGFYHMTRLSANLRYSPFLNDSRLISNWQGLHEEQAQIVLPGSRHKEQVFSYNRKIFSSNYSDIVGLIEIEVGRNLFFEAIHHPSAPYAGNIMIVNGQDRVVSEPNGDSKWPWISIQELGLDNIPGEDLNKIMDVRGERSIVISTPLGGPELRLVGIFPVTPFISSMKSSQIRMFGVLLAALLLLSIIVYWITHALLHRMKVLLSAMKAVREGNLNVSVPVVSNDEFAQMSLSFNLMTSRIHELVETAYKMKILEKEAELRALESQINPHFLYNTLATISWVGRKVQSPDVVHLSNSLARFYRLVLNKGKSSIEIQDEIEMVRTYANIQKFRFENLFDIVFELDESVLLEVIPKNILQPLVENALTHGIEPKREHGTVTVKAALTSSGHSIVIQVMDDGVGMTEERIDEVLNGQVERTSGSGYAIKNIIERLNGYYGNQADFKVRSRPGAGTVFTLTLPKE